MCIRYNEHLEHRTEKSLRKKQTSIQVTSLVDQMQCHYFDSSIKSEGLMAKQICEKVRIVRGFEIKLKKPH